VGSAVLRYEGRELDCVPEDVSLGGARLRRAGPVDPARLPFRGCRVQIDFIRPRGRHAFSVQGVLARVDGADAEALSVKFELDEVAAEQLRRFLTTEAVHLGIPVSELGQARVSMTHKAVRIEVTDRGAPKRRADVVAWVAVLVVLLAGVAAWLSLRWGGGWRGL
jgi:hypothetical protein